VPATGRTVEFPAFHIVRFSEDLAVEWWGTADLLGALVQLAAQVRAPSAVELTVRDNVTDGLVD
jgi:hypothetical protein